MQNLENRLTLLIWLAFAADYLGWLDPIVSVLDQIGITSGKTRITVWSVLKLLFTLDTVRPGRRLDQPLDRPAPEAPVNARALDAHRPRQVRQRVPDRAQHSRGAEYGRGRSHRADGAHRRHRPRTGIRPAVDRLEFRERLRAAHGPLHQARRCHQPVRTERHEHGELRLGAGAARPLRRGARPRRHRDAGAQSAASSRTR